MSPVTTCPHCQHLVLSRFMIQPAQWWAPVLVVLGLALLLYSCYGIEALYWRWKRMRT